MNRRIYKLLLFCMVSMLSVFVHAANMLEVTYQIGNTQKKSLLSEHHWHRLGITTHTNMITLHTSLNNSSFASGLSTGCRLRSSRSSTP